MQQDKEQKPVEQTQECKEVIEMFLKLTNEEKCKVAGVMTGIQLAKQISA